MSSKLLQSALIKRQLGLFTFGNRLKSPVKRLSTIITLYFPVESNFSVKLLPIKPAAPVTNTFFNSFSITL